MIDRKVISFISYLSITYLLESTSSTAWFCLTLNQTLNFPSPFFHHSSLSWSSRDDWQSAKMKRTQKRQSKQPKQRQAATKPTIKYLCSFSFSSSSTFIYFIILLDSDVLFVHFFHFDFFSFPSFLLDRHIATSCMIHLIDMINENLKSLLRDLFTFWTNLKLLHFLSSSQSFKIVESQ